MCRQVSSVRNRSQLHQTEDQREGRVEGTELFREEHSSHLFLIN